MPKSFRAARAFLLALAVAILTTASDASITADAPRKVDRVAEQIVRLLVVAPDPDDPDTFAIGQGSGLVYEVDKSTCNVKILTARHVTDQGVKIWPGNGRAVSVVEHPTEDAAIVYGTITPCDRFDNISFAKRTTERVFNIGIAGMFEHLQIYSGRPSFSPFEDDEGLFPWWVHAVEMWGVFGLPGMSGGSVVDAQGHVFGILVGGNQWVSISIYVPVNNAGVEALDRYGDEHRRAIR